uniref:Uncharacterized protein n=1 Tax=Wuchereria bancrofti TaxID=6293 RepID=A0AAF5PMG8_WUCBA
MHFWHFSNDHLEYCHIFQNVPPLYLLVLVLLPQFSYNAL